MSARLAVLIRGKFVLLGICLLVCSMGCQRRTAPAADGEAVPVAAAQYVGDAACASCHADIAAAYHRTNKGRSITRFDAAAAPEQFGEAIVYHAPTGFFYQAFVRNDTLFQREFKQDDEGRVLFERTYPAAWVIGSGNATRSYLMDINGYVTQMPLTWYMERAKWDLSPGYHTSNSRFSRPITQQCMVCHDALPGYSTFSQNHFTEVPLGISCERCHGPGSKHQEIFQAEPSRAANSVDTAIVNPARLDRAHQLSICQQCHLEGTTVLKPGETYASYHPGTLLASHRSVFVTRASLENPEEFGIASHAVRLAKSACFQQSEMTCTTCHDPHQPIEELGADHYNQACQSCHATTHDAPVCSREEAHGSSEAAMSGNCVSCHLQKSGTTDIPHVTFTDHWIRRRPPRGRQAPERSLDNLRRQEQEEPFELVRVTEGTGAPVADEALAALEEAIAYFSFYETAHPRPAYLPLVTARAREGLAAGAEHVEARLVLARALMEQDSLAAAEEVLQQAADRFPEHARVLYWLGAVQLERGRPQEALKPLQKAWERQPAFVEAAIKLGDALSEAGRLDDGARVLEEVVRRNPVHHPEAWNNLGFIRLQQQRLGEAQTALEQALALNPDFAVALVNAGTVELMRQDLTAAARYFERATVADSSYAPAFGNLGVVYAQQGKYDRARAMLRRVLDLQPGDRRAQALLQQLNRM